MAQAFTQANWQAEVIDSEKPVVADFSAAWCGPCRILSPTIDKIAKERTDVKVGKVDTEENQDLTAQYRVSAIPTVIFFKGGKELHRFSGVMGEKELNKLIDDTFSK